MLTTKKRINSKLTTGEPSSYSHDVFLNGFYINFEILQSHGYYDDGTKRPWSYTIFVRDTRNNSDDLEERDFDTLEDAVNHLKKVLGVK